MTVTSAPELPKELLAKPALGAFAPRDQRARAAWIIQGCRRYLAETQERSRLIFRFDTIMRGFHLGLRADLIARDLRRLADDIDELPSKLMTADIEAEAA